MVRNAVFIMMVIAGWAAAAAAHVFCAMPARDPIAVYASATSYEPITYLASVNGSDIFYDCDIVEDSPLRFKVEYIICSCFSDQKGTGWVNKSDLVGYVLDTCDVDGGFYVYENYDDTEGRLIEAQSVEAHPLAVYFPDDDGRVYKYTKVLFEYNGEVIVGWVKRFCGDQYQSCN